MSKGVDAFHLIATRDFDLVDDKIGVSHRCGSSWCLFRSFACCRGLYG